ncbi:MAG: TlpA family protein disulfide reductase [Bacteroidia bacterium]|nr:MAG: TlpA family protein disulfide reductase [Bacteroidia bacterium]
MKNYLLILFSLVSFLSTAQVEKLTVGQQAPILSMPTIKGEPFDYSTLKGKVVLLDFWASWCSPCVKEQPFLKELYAEFENEVSANKFEIIGISLDKEKANWENAVKKLKITWPQVGDLLFWRSQAAKDYKIEGLPANFVLNENGVIIAIDLHGEELKAFLTNYFNR